MNKMINRTEQIDRILHSGAFDRAIEELDQMYNQPVNLFTLRYVISKIIDLANGDTVTIVTRFKDGRLLLEYLKKHKLVKVAYRGQTDKLGKLPKADIFDLKASKRMKHYAVALFL